jgi:hypothetical protein
MKSKLLALAVLVAMTSAASAKTNWQGEAMVLEVSGCEASGDKVGDSYLVMYQPKNGAGISDNSTSNFLSFVQRWNATSLKFNSFAANVAYTGVQISGRGHHLTTAGNITSISTTPAVNSTTQTFVMNAVIKNFYNTSGCTATIRASFVRRIDPPAAP